MDGFSKETDMNNAPLKILVLGAVIAGLQACASSPASPGATSADNRRLEDSFKSMWATGPWANDYNFISPR